ncbi:MAG: hypothetical protein V1753_06910 [Pseudomonadota bacterium]
MANLEFCTCCGVEGNYQDNVCEECYGEIEREKRDFEAEKQYRENHC